MNLMKWLRRLGILRFGAEGGVYHNAKERPLSLQQHDVFDSKQDAIPLREQSRQEESEARTVRQA